MDGRHALSGTPLDGAREFHRIGMARLGERPPPKVLQSEQGRPKGAAVGTTTVDDRPHNPDEIMENQTSFDLNQEIQHWRDNLAQSPAIGRDSLDEME